MVFKGAKGSFFEYLFEYLLHATNTPLLIFLYQFRMSHYWTYVCGLRLLHLLQTDSGLKHESFR